MSTTIKIALFGAVVALVAVLFLPSLRQVFTRLTTSSETVLVPRTSDAVASGAEGPATELEIVTLLGFDAIPAILDPDFVTADETEDWMGTFEQVLGVSINGENRAYSISMLSRHEIVNDVVGGVPIAVTW